MSSSINFTPWVGKEYSQGIGERHYKVLVLGESHYCKLEHACELCSPENCAKRGYSIDEWHYQTIEYIDNLINAYSGDNKYQQTGLCFERAVSGKVLSDEERKSFWNHVVFYNYIQKDLIKVGSNRTSFTYKDISSSEQAFKEILEKYLPDKIIVWGVRLYNNLPDWGGSPSTIEIKNGDKTDVWTYHIKGKEIEAMKVYHPSTPSGKAWQYWHEFYDLFINK